MLVKVGTFSKPTGAQPVSQSITGLGFQPKLVMLIATRLTAAGWNNTNTSHHIAIGASDGTSEWTRCVAVQDNSAAPEPSCSHTNAKALRITTVGVAPTTLAECDLTMTADGFDLNWTTNNAEAWQVGYKAIGGANVSAKVGTFDSPGVTGNQAITDIGFTPKLLVLVGSMPSTVANATDDNANFAIGVFDGTTQAVLSGGARSQGTSNARKGQNTTKVYQAHNVGDPRTLHIEASAVSLDADGFTNNFTVVTVQSALGYICLGGSGFSAKVVADAAKLTTGTQATTGVGFLPKSLLAFAWGRTASASLDFDPAWSLCLTDSVNNHVSGLMDISASPTQTSNNHMTTKAVATMHTGDNTATVVEAGWSAFGSDGYTLNYTKVTGSAEQIIVVAMGGAEGGGKGSGGKGKGGQTPGPGAPPPGKFKSFGTRSWPIGKTRLW